MWSRMEQMMVEYDDCSNAGHGHMFPEFHSDTPTTDPRAYQVINPIPLQGKISKYLPSKPTIIILYKYKNELLTIDERARQQDHQRQEVRGAGQEPGQLRELGGLTPPPGVMRMDTLTTKKTSKSTFAGVGVVTLVPLRRDIEVVSNQQRDNEPAFLCFCLVLDKQPARFRETNIGVSLWIRLSISHRRKVKVQVGYESELQLLCQLGLCKEPLHDRLHKYYWSAKAYHLRIEL
ncbi:hypothetical protein HL42_7633 [Trichophyton rubrum]|nr:hypothetical protein HL42_7633 [Trichophyton rubrum]